VAPLSPQKKDYSTDINFAMNKVFIALDKKVEDCWKKEIEQLQSTASRKQRKNSRT